MDLEQKYIDGCELLDGNQLHKAKDIFEQILKQHPEHYEAINKYGVVMARLGNQREAKKSFERALYINCDYAPAIVNMGNIYKEDGKDDDAMLFYNRAVDKDPDYHIAYHNMAVIYKNKGDYDKYVYNMKQYKRCYRKYLKDRSNFHKVNIDQKPGHKAMGNGKLVYLVGIIAILFISIFLFQVYP